MNIHDNMKQGVGGKLASQVVINIFFLLCAIKMKPGARLVLENTFYSHSPMTTWERENEQLS